MQVTTTWRNDNPATIWNRLAARLGREPTDAEASAEVKRILREATDARLVDAAGRGALPWQRRR